MTNQDITLEIVGKGKALREYNHEGKTFIESRDGRNYSVRVKNNTNRRVLAIVSVDSLNAITGKESSGGPDEAGYIINAYDSYDVRGFRVDDNTVAAFRFVRKGKSYATSVGAGQGNGVIAVRVYREKEVRPMPIFPIFRSFSGPTKGIDSSDWYEKPRGVSLNMMDAGPISYTSNLTMSASSLDERAKCSVKIDPFSHGTQFGEATADKITHVTFEPGTLLRELTIYYAPYDGLKALGINLTREKQVSFPEPFPREYARPPAGWHR